MAVAHPSRRDDRVILHVDYDCFYASVFEAEQPALKCLPLAVQQKQIIVTCNYEARRRGLRKLQLIRDAKRICPEVVVVLGEDLTRFRDASKDLYLFLKSFVWGDRVEKLGFDELFLDVTSMIEYNLDFLNQNDLQNSFFYLDRQDLTVGFPFDATEYCGQTWPSRQVPERHPPFSAGLAARLKLASHLAGYLRSELEHRKGYTATAGISTCKLLAKLVGSTHKPNSQTTLIPPYDSGEDDDDEHAPDAQGNVQRFMDGHEIAKIPGIGSKTAHKLRAYISAGSSREPDRATGHFGVTVHDARICPGMDPTLISQLVGASSDAPRGIGVRIWQLLHGVDNSEVSQSRDFPTQISIEDSYGALDNFEQVKKEMVALAASLIRRMRVDLTENARLSKLPTSSGATDDGNKVRWRAQPRTLRLTTRPRISSSPDAAGRRLASSSRISRSTPLPRFVFSLEERVDALAERLVLERLVSMFRKLHPEKSGWKISLLNVAVTNMAEIAANQKDGRSSGQDIEKLLQAAKQPRSCPPSISVTDAGSTEDTWQESDEDAQMPVTQRCHICAALVPQFALLAHEQFHDVSA